MFWLLGINNNFPATGRFRVCDLVLLLCCLSTAGCSLASDTHRVFFLAKRTTKLEPRCFPYLRDEKLSQMRNRSLAKHAWHEIVAGSPTGSFSEHYGRGFIHGFADYLYRGGSGEPPLVPPRDYWHAGYQTIKGKEAIGQWFEGFRHGSQECATRGYRDLVVAPSSMDTAQRDYFDGDTLPHVEPPHTSHLTDKVPPLPTTRSTNSNLPSGKTLRSPYQRH